MRKIQYEVSYKGCRFYYTHQGYEIQGILFYLMTILNAEAYRGDLLQAWEHTCSLTPGRYPENGCDTWIALDFDREKVSYRLDGLTYRFRLQQGFDWVMQLAPLLSEKQNAPEVNRQFIDLITGERPTGPQYPGFYH